MRRWSTWILILALALLALCVLWLLPRLLREEPEEPARGIAATAEARPAPEPVSRSDAGSSPQPTSTPQPNPQPTPEPSRPAEERAKEPPPARESAEEATPAPVRGSLAGRLVDRTGRPVQGAIVLAARAPELGTPIEPAQWWIAHLPLDVADPRALGAEEPLRSTSDAAGRFALDGLEPGRVRLAVRSTALAPLDRENLRLAPGERLELGDLLLEPGAFLFGFLQDASGRPLAGVPIVESDEFTDASLPPIDPKIGRELAVTDARGGFRSRPLRDGPWSARALGGESLLDAPMRGSSTAEGWNRLETMGAAGGLRGSISTHGAVPPELVVRALPADHAHASVSFARRADARTGSVLRDGTFAIVGLAPGVLYELRAGLGEERFEDESLWSPPTFAAAEDDDVRVRWEPDATVSFAIVDPHGRNLVGSCEVELGGALPALASLAAPDPGSDGLHVLSGVRPLRPAARASLWVGSRGFLPLVQRLELRPGRATSLGALALNPAPSLDVRVVDAVTRTAIRGALVAASDSMTGLDGSGLPPQAVATDAEGAAGLVAFAGSSTQIEVRAPGYARQRRAGPFGGGFSTPRVEIGLYRGARARIQVLDEAGRAVPGARVEWIEGTWSPNESSRSRETVAFLDRPDPETTRYSDADGRVEFGHLAPGRHAFRVQRWDRSLDGEWTQRELADGEVAWIELESVSPSSLDVRIADGTTPLAGAPVVLLRRSAVDSLLGVAEIEHPLPPGIDARLDSAGAHAFSNLDPGLYVLAFAVPGQRLRGCRDVQVGAGSNALSIDLAPTAVAGRVTGEGGRPVAGATVRLSEPDREQELRLGIRRRGWSDATPEDLLLLGNEHAAAVSGEDGGFRLLGLPIAESFRILACDEEYGLGKGEPLMVRRDTGPAEADVALAPSGALEVRAATTPAASPFLLFAVPSDRRGIPRIVRMFPGRSAFLRALEPGAWDVQLADGSSRPRERRRIEIVAGETRLVELPLP